MHDMRTPSAERRRFIQQTGTGLLLGLGFLVPRRLLGAWQESAFAADDLDGVLKELYDARQPQESEQVQVEIPEIAENGALVPVTVTTDLKRVESIGIIVPENPNPLAAVFEMTPYSIPNVSIRIKMASTSDVWVVVNTGDALHLVRKEVKVTVGGCA